MDLISNSTCGLCDENTSVLSRKAVQPFITTVGKVFFNANKNEFEQFQDELLIKTICSLCAQKISSCTKFKSSYDSVNKKNGLKKNRCFVCSKKGLDLIRTSDDPNDIITKFTLFTNYSPSNTSYEDCELCLDCLFHINSWCEVHNNLIRRLNIDGQSLKGFQRINCNPNILKKDKENVTPPHNNIQTSNTKLRTSGIKKKLIGPKSSKKLIGPSKKSKTKNNKLATHFLSGKLKSIKCLQDGTFRGLSWPESVSSDRKMVMEIPYVLISQVANKDNVGSQGRKSSRLNKPIEIINISDTEEEPVKRTTRVSFQLPISTIIEQTNLTCNLCDKEFTVLSKFQSHSLWHEKPERCQIDLVRYELPNYVKASEFNIKKKPAKVDENIDDIVSKYIPQTRNIDDDSEAKEEDERIRVSEDDNEKLNSEEPQQSESLCENETSNHTEIDLVNNVQDSENLEKEVENLDEENIRAQSVSPTFDLCVDTSNTIETEVVCNPESESGKDDVEEASVEPEDIHNNTDDQINSSKESVVTNETNGESDIEKALAKLHEEDDDEEEKDVDDKVENFDGNEEVSDGGSIASDDDNDGSEVSLKRKRVDSPGYEENSDDQNNSDDNTPKIKKVRFAIDYSCTQQSEETVKNNDDEQNLNNGEEHNTQIAVTNEDDNVC